MRVDWSGFEDWVFREYRTKHQAQTKINYARAYAHCLLTGNLSELRMLSDDKRCHVLKALSALSKFLGVHTQFKTLVKDYGLKWGGKSSDDLIIARLTKPENSQEMYEWMRRAKEIAGDFGVFIDFMAATGLRYEEAVNSWNLIIELSVQGKLSKYYMEAKQVLEHFKFKETFIRKSKKAFISFVSTEMVKKIAGSKKLTVNTLANKIKRARVKLRFGDIREFHGSLLTKTHSEPEINFIHGRVSTGIFMRNYFNPAWISDLQQRTLRAASEILAKIN